jgi:acyl CoA:acetate/3-ketoacid CoA transferase beta subunit
VVVTLSLKSIKGYFRSIKPYASKINFQSSTKDMSIKKQRSKESGQAIPDEIMVVCMSRQLQDGEIVAQGLATPLVSAAYLLARYTHAPNLYFASAIGQSVCRDPAPLGLTNIESLWLDRALTSVGFVRAVTDVLPNLRPKEFFRPGQIDTHGNFNNVAIGKNYLSNGRRHPRLRLPGTGGIPDVTTFIDDIYLYVPRHSRVTFVPRLDVRSGLGHDAERTHGSGPRYLVSDLGQFDFHNGRLRLITYHPGVEVKRIQAKTGFTFELAPDLHQTPAPTQEELTLLREVIDPLGIRRLELLAGSSRRNLLREIVEVERRSEKKNKSVPAHP